jgi:hypothetical protein
MLDDMLDYIEHIRERPVWQPIPDDVRAHFRTSLPNAPTDLASVHDEFMRYILPYATGNVHPGFMGWVHGGGNAAGDPAADQYMPKVFTLAVGTHQLILRGREGGTQVQSFGGIQ